MIWRRDTGPVAVVHKANFVVRIQCVANVGSEQARRWQISMGGPSPPNSPKSPLFVRVPPYLHTKIFSMGGAMAPLAPPSATGLAASILETTLSENSDWGKIVEMWTQM